MSDDHVAQRTAIRSIWGSTMRHCRCRFHFEKRILEGPFNLNRKLKTVCETISRRKIILDAHAESSQVGLEKLIAFAKKLEALVN